MIQVLLKLLISFSPPGFCGEKLTYMEIGVDAVAPGSPIILISPDGTAVFYSE
jgi:hypothetical protein